jgi:uncharacterized protein YndB with AHSA1/START domain
VLSNGVSVERFVKAPASAIFSILADPSRHREIDGSGTLRDAKGGSSRLAQGATFRMDMKAGAPYVMVNEVVEFEADRRIAWQARPDKGWAQKAIGGRIWRYELEPRDGGTLVRETWDISQEQFPPLVWGLRRLTRISMSRTLKRIEEIVA